MRYLPPGSSTLMVRSCAVCIVRAAPGPCSVLLASSEARNRVSVSALLKGLQGPMGGREQKGVGGDLGRRRMYEGLQVGLLFREDMSDCRNVQYKSHHA